MDVFSGLAMWQHPICMVDTGGGKVESPPENGGRITLIKEECTSLRSTCGIQKDGRRGLELESVVMNIKGYVVSMENSL